MMSTLLRALIISLALVVFAAPALAQVEVYGWGEMRGIRVDGELMPVSTSLRAANPDWSHVARTAHWQTRDPGYARDEDGKIVSKGQISFFRGRSLAFKQMFTDAAPGAVSIDLNVTANNDTDLAGVYFFVSVPASQYSQGTGQLLGATTDAPVSLATTRPAADKHYLGGLATGAQLAAPHHQVQIMVDGEPRGVVIQDDRADGGETISAFFALGTGDLKKGQTLHASCRIRVTGDVDKAPATVRIDPSDRGGAFAGIGGNFVYGTQSPSVQYYLDNLRVTWARVGVPLPAWQPRQEVDPSGQPVEQLNGEVREALRMAKELHRRGIPTMASVWNAPRWAYAQRGGGGGSWRGGRIEPGKWDALAGCISSYLLMLKKNVGVEPELFSFNESNMGINVLLSPEEHRDAIKKLGAQFASVGLRTKLLLGDTGDAHAVDYVKATLADPEAMKYVGAISYHSWNSRTAEELRGWRQHAVQAKLPLFVAEAGTDSDAHRYPAVWQETWAALEEAVMYQQCLSLSQPAAMLHWELTPDYGLVREARKKDDPVQPTMRWWAFRQLSQLTPAGAVVLASSSDKETIVVSALSAPDAGSTVSVIHLVNSGAQRAVTLSGLAADAKPMRCYLTDAKRGMQELEQVAPAGGTIQLTLPAQSFVTLTQP